MAARVELWLGPPGTGKTTSLLERVEQELAHGVPLERIAFLSFSRRAVQNALDRLGVTRDQAPNFRTIHALGYHLCNLSPSQVVRPSHLFTFGQEIEEVFSTAHRDQRGTSNEDDPVQTATTTRAAVTRGDTLLALYTTSRAKSIPIAQAWEAAAPLRDVDLKAVLRFEAQYSAWKEDSDLYDFSDMISLASGQLDVDVVIVDEAQDTTATQWRLLRSAVPATARVVLAGDDDQAIYTWAGADVQFLHRVVAETKVLPHSYRLPRSVKAIGDRVSSRIGARHPKLYTPRDAEGSVEHIRDVGAINLRRGNWLLLARTRAQLARWVWLCKMQGVVYQYTHASRRDEEHWSWQDAPVMAVRSYHRLSKGTAVTRQEARTLLPFAEGLTERARNWAEWVTWGDVFPGKNPSLWMDALPGLSPYDVEYVRELRKNGESLSRPGRVRISTIHHAKGSEAENVGLLTGLTPRVERGRVEEPDNEYRVQYVGITRAKERLVLVSAGAKHQYRF